MNFLLPLIAVLRELLPGHKDNNQTWFLKVFVIFAITGTIALSGFYVLTSTTLGQRYGIELNTKIPEMTHAEFLINRRFAWRQLASLRLQSEFIHAAYQLMLIDKKTNNFPLDSLPVVETDVVIWEFEIPVRQSLSLELVEDVINQLQNEYQSLFEKSTQCRSFPLKNPVLSMIKRGVPGFDSTHAALCPINTFYRPRLVGATLILYQLKAPYTEFFFEDKLRTATIQIASHTRSLARHYQILMD